MAVLESAKELQKVLEQFKIDNDISKITEMKSGHINTTYLVDTVDSEGNIKSFVVQKVNTYVFKDPVAVMENIDKVTGFIRNNNPHGSLHYHHTVDGKNYIMNNDCFWRLYTYREGSAFNECSTDVLEAVGKAFGEFQLMLQDFDSSTLVETIPEFHNTRKRYNHLLDTVKKDPKGRVKKVSKELELVEELKDVSLKVCDLASEGKFPIRTTHNDTKVNNALLEKDTLKPLLVIDLDTVMPGLIVHDFGDAIRFGANKAEEDEKDLSKVKLSLPKFYAFARGFIGQTKGILTKVEVENMALGAIAMTFECGIRFLDDYLDGDNYFKIDYTSHNLDRARCQLALAKDMIDNLEEMNKIIALLAY